MTDEMSNGFIQIGDIPRDDARASLTEEERLMVEGLGPETAADFTRYINTLPPLEAGKMLRAIGHPTINTYAHEWDPDGFKTWVHKHKKTLFGSGEETA